MAGSSERGAGGQGLTWEVENQLATTGQDSSGTFTRGAQVNVRVSDGTLLSVFVPESQYRSVDGVRKLIQTRVDQHAAVAGLTG